MARKSKRAICKDSDINSLNSIIYGDYSGDLKRRAQCIIYSSEGKSNKEVSELTGLSPNWTGTWIKRFNEEGIDGILDRPRSGRKGGEAIPNLLSMIREKLSETPPDGETSWSAESLAKELGISINSVRNAIRGTDVSFDRKRIWDFDTNGELIAKNLDIVGFYCSKTEKALVLSASRDLVAYEGSGSFSTRNKDLADELMQYTVKKADNVSLSEVLSIATEHTNDDRRFSEGSLKQFLDSLIDNLPQSPGTLYSVFLFCEGNTDQRMLRHAGIQFMNTVSMEKWHEAVESFISLHCDNVTEVVSLKAALKRYLENRTDRSETFQWKKQLTLKSENEPVSFDAKGQSVESIKNSNFQGLTEEDSDIQANNSNRKSRIRITFDYIDELGEMSSAVIEVKNLKNPSECDSSSRESILEFVSDLERCVLPAVDRGTQLLGKMAMEAVKKKHQHP